MKIKNRIYDTRQPVHCIPSNPFMQKQQFRCSKCGKSFIAVNGRIQENSLETNPFSKPSEQLHFFDRLKKPVLHCPECGEDIEAYWSISE